MVGKQVTQASRVFRLVNYIEIIRTEDQREKKRMCNKRTRIHEKSSNNVTSGLYNVMVVFININIK